MPHNKDISIRDARDRLIDLLGFGETYPLRDLAILDEQLTVPFNTSAKIPLEPSQLEVLYQLYDREDHPVKRNPRSPKGIQAKGTGDTLLIESPQIQDDVTYKLKAVKTRTNRSVYLHETATIKVGLDVSLKAEILSGERLDPGIETARETDPRIVDYGLSVNVKVKLSQEGVDYRLVYFEGSKEVVLTEEDVRGNLADIVLVSRAVYEDIDLRLRATKTFDPSEGRDTQTELLDIILPLKVRAAPVLNVVVEPSPVIDFEGKATLRIDNTQKSAQYQLWIQKIADANFIHGTSSASEILPVMAGNGQKVQVRDPSSGLFKSLVPGFQETGTPKKGTGDLLRFSLEGLTDDSLVIVKATKTHAAQDPISSTVQLKQASVILVRPDSKPALMLKVKVKGTEAVGPVLVSGGQPGVFYHLGPEGEGDPLGLPAYFHKKDEWNPIFNKGLGQLKVEVDLVVPRDLAQDSSASATEAAKTFPADPLVEIQNIPLGSTLSLLAVKAQTGIEQLLTQQAVIPALPDISFEKMVIPTGTAAKVIVTDSQVGERYQLFLNGTAVRQARNGNGQTLAINTDPLTEETTFEMRITRPGVSESLDVEQIILMKVEIQPERPE